MFTQEEISNYKKHHRLTNFVSAAMLYLNENYFLKEELKKEHLKKRILGHWGTVPGLNFIYGGLNILAKNSNRNIAFVAGPGHGAPSILSNLFLEGIITEFYKQYSYDLRGLGKFIKDFSWPGGFPSHTSPKVPGTILEGGELGYSLATAYGTIMDRPDLITVCAVGDGEAETGTLSASWHLNKFINPEKDGVVLPIIHLNGYRISGPTIMGTMSDEELIKYFEGLGYQVFIVDQYISKDIYKEFLKTLEQTVNKIDQVKAAWSSMNKIKPIWPLIILRTKKGWTGPVELNGKMIEDNNLSHGIPLQNPTDDEEFRILSDWLNSYNLEELINDKFIDSEILKLIPEDKKVGRAFLNYKNNDLVLPRIEDYELKIFKRGERDESRMEKFSEYLRDTADVNEEKHNFRMFSPDETESNLMGDIFAEASRVYLWPLREQDEYFAKSGRIIELLSENVLLEMYKGYALTNRYGILVSYEAFLNIVSSQIDQHIKYLKGSSELTWREEISSINLVSTSTLWRQEHNGYTHQNPSLINSLLSKQSDFVRLYFPSDVNTLLATAEKVLPSRSLVNHLVVCKRNLPQWLYLNEAKEHVVKGISKWDWVSNDNENEPDVVITSCGEYQTLEAIAAIDLLQDLAPSITVRFININEISYKGLGSFDNPLDTTGKISEYFTSDREVIFSFHGYPTAIQMITFKTSLAPRIKVLGYKEEGTTTTPFDMQVLNGTSRYHICIEAIKSAVKFNSRLSKDEELLVSYFEKKLQKHKEYIVEHGDDLPEIKEWKWAS